MKLHPRGDGISDHIRRSGDFYEAVILDELGRLFPEQTVIVDAGANIGNHSLYWASTCRSAVIHAIEPLPANYALLTVNARGWPRIHLYPVALSDNPGPVRMTPNAANMGGSSVTEDGPIIVQAITLDSLALPSISLLKIDVEGQERRVLAGAQETLARCRPLVWVEDWHGNAGDLLPDYRPIAYWPGSNFLWQPA